MNTSSPHPKSPSAVRSTGTSPLKGVYRPAVRNESGVLKAASIAIRDEDITHLKAILLPHEMEEFRNVLLNIVSKLDDSRTSICSFKALQIDISPGWNIFIQRLLKKIDREDDAKAISDILFQLKILSRYEDFLKDRVLDHRICVETSSKFVKDDVFKPVLLAGRKDLTSLKSFAIDETSTSIIDDAISYDLSRMVVFVHIADVVSYLEGGCHNHLISKAARNGKTFYLHRKRYPMFPDNISKKLLSLGGKETSWKYAITYEFRLRNNGGIDESSFKVYKSVISRPKELSYNSVSESLKKNKACPELAMLYNLVLRLRQSRTGVRQDYSNQGKNAHVLVEELMIAANFVAATIAKRSNIPIIYRVVRATGDKKPRLSTNQEAHSKLGLPCYTNVTSPLRKFVDLVNHMQILMRLNGDRLPYNIEELEREIPLIENSDREIYEAEARLKRFQDYTEIKSMIGGAKEGIFTGRLVRQVDADSGLSFWELRISRSNTCPNRSTQNRTIHKDMQSKTCRNERSMNKKVDLKVRLDNFDSTIVLNAPSSGSTDRDVQVVITEIDPHTSYVEAAFVVDARNEGIVGY